MIHPRVLKEVADQISSALEYVYNIWLVDQELPDDWKSSIVSAVHKKRSKMSVCNYRPISLTCIACKVMESFVRDHVMSFLLKNKLISNRQYGFIQGRSTALQLLTILYKWTEMSWSWVDRLMSFIQTSRRPSIEYHIEDCSAN